MSFRLRLVLGGVLVAALVLALFTWGVDALIGTSMREDQERRVAVAAEESVASLGAASREALRAGVAPTAVTLDESEGSFVAAFDAGGRLLFTTVRPKSTATALLAAMGGRTASAGERTATVAGVELRLAARRWERPALALSGVLVAGEPARLAESERTGGRVFLAISGVIALLVATLATWFVSGRAIRPLRDLAATAAEIGATGDLGRRLPARRRQDVLGTLTTSFNAMLDRLADSRRRTEDALERQRRFAADASHELRTPLTTIRANAGLLLERDEVTPADRREALADIAAEGERMSALVEGLLLLARGDEAAGGFASGPVDLEPVVREAAAVSERSGLPVTLETADITVSGDREALFRVVRILLDNAAVHATGREVSVRLAAESGVAVLEVADRGPGIPAGDLPHVFDRFYRADSARSGPGAGLGLAIARAVVEAHRGSIAAANRPGGGAVLTVTLPVLAAPE